ncbi:leucine-rich repeat-containing protein 53-like [Oncorhynchus tshawytscha]|uniref:Leucine-rich repeat-containing protein 53 n=1 Tax=Oncorhynchus tshawytscha TaxID=74940 RepID=A0A8C8HK87_ONCTS|nr:leucine-rich repeat-containing protein 53-like [Oncorhynchus tshawytscha]
MRSVLLMLMLSITRTQCLSSCPASCVVCSDDAVICHKLSNFIEAPETTKALMLTDGAIVSVDRHFLSDMSNMTVLSLSHNAITTLTHDAFQNLTILHTLLLDHNHLSSQTLDRATFSWLPRLEILQLGNNALREVKGSWFHAARALRTLQLGGNRLTRLDATTFASADLRALETLDLSDNLITYLGRDSFRGLPGLRSLDLSRNQLRNALPEAFSYLSWLTSLNLELNRWNCTCELRELASFLTSYMEAPDKVLFNGRRMVCVSADNPAVKTVLELTEANCVPPNQNITVQVEAKNSVSPQRYTRDLALAAAFCFAGGVGLTLAVVYIIYRKLETNKRDRTGAKEEENRRTAPTQTVPQWDPIRENQAVHLAQMGLETKLKLPNSNQQGSHLQPWERERAMYDLRMGKDGRHFTRPHCVPAVTGSAVEQGGGDEHMNTLDMLRQGGAQPNKMGSLAMTDERRRHVPTQALISKMEDLRGQRSFNRPPEGHQELLDHQQGYKKHGPNGNNQPLGGSNSYFSPAQRNMSTHKGLRDEMARPGNYIDNKQSNLNFQPEGGRPVTDYQPQTASCVNCHRTYEYRQPGDKARDVSYGLHARESAGYEGFPNHNQLTRQNMGKNMNYNQSNVDIYAKHASEQRSVTFDLERPRVHVVDVQKMNRDREGKHDMIQSSRKAEYGDTQTLRYEDSGRSARSNALEREDNSKRYKHKVQSSGLLKVKLNLNPLKKSKVHPRKNSHKNLEQGDRVPTNSKNRKQLKTRGKDVKGKRHHQDESESKGKTDKSSKGNSTAKNKANQTSKNKSTISKSKEIDDNYEDK